MEELRFNVAQLLKEHTGATREYELKLDIGTLDPEIKAVGELVGSLKFTRVSQGILVEAQLQTKVELVCVRCLKPFVALIRFTMEEEFIPTLDVMSGTPLPPPPGSDEALLIDIHHILDLTEALRQNILVSLPMHPVCKPDCLGLCPHCGQDLNEGPCGCQEMFVDPRWAALAKLKR